MARKPRSHARAATCLAVPPGLLLAVFTAAIFVSAALLFAVQPMFTKIVLPRLGGSPSVWSVAMVFFQAVLLAGYAYAHFLMRHAPGRAAVIVHVLVMVAATLMLPLLASVPTNYQLPIHNNSPRGSMHSSTLGGFLRSIRLRCGRFQLRIGGFDAFHRAAIRIVTRRGYRND